MKTRFLVVMVAAALLPLTPVFGHGASTQSRRSSHDEAVDSFNEGVKARERAAKLEAELATQTDPGKRSSLQQKVQKTYATVIRMQKQAIQSDETLYQAYGELGYAYRKSGDYPSALEPMTRPSRCSPTTAMPSSTAPKPTSP